MEPSQFMQRCFELAQHAKGYTAPNPMVGAVLVHEGKILAEGWHRAYGSHHAEVDCLLHVPDEQKQLICESTLYVNLEPCAHFGKTPPCADRLVAEKVNKVVIANTDPFAQVSGKGIAILQQAGVAVEVGLLAAQGAWLNRRFFTFHTQKRPYIILKWAKTPNGMMAPANRSRLQITNPHSQRLLHQWRTQEGAILIGSATLQHDNPALTARLWQGKQPLRVVIGSNATHQPQQNIADEVATTWIVNAHFEGLKDNIHYRKIDFKGDTLVQTLSLLHANGIQSVIVEGGAKLLQSFLQADLWDEARVFTGVHTIDEGIPAPTLTNGVLAFHTPIGSNNLEVYTHKATPYPWVAGMPL